MKKVFVVTFGNKGENVGDYVDHKAHAGLKSALDACSDFMESYGGRDTFSEDTLHINTPNHIYRQWSNARYTLWLEQLNVQERIKHGIA